MLHLVLPLSLSHTGHWKFNMAPHGKELSEDLKKIIVALHKDSVGYEKDVKIPVDQQLLKYSDQSVWHQQPVHVQSHLNPLSSPF